MKTDRIWIDRAQGIARFSGNDMLYSKFLLKFPEDPTFEQLKAAMEKKDYAEAFRCAHTLKGISGNLSLIALHDDMKDFVEQLRGGKDIPGALAAWKPLQRDYQDTLDAICTQS